MVFSGFVTAWRLATWPTSRSPFFVNATTDGVVRPPSWLGITVGWPPSMTATTEFVVPRSMPIILPILVKPPLDDGGPSGDGLKLSTGPLLNMSVALSSGFNQGSAPPFLTQRKTEKGRRTQRKQFCWNEAN